MGDFSVGWIQLWGHWELGRKGGEGGSDGVWICLIVSDSSQDGNKNTGYQKQMGGREGLVSFSPSIFGRNGGFVKG